MGRLNKLESRYGAANYKPLPVTLVRAEGVHVWDEDGRRYLDMMGAYSAASFGHCHPRLVAAMTQQANRLDTVSRAYFTDRLGPFLARACELTGMDAALPGNGGAELVETAIKAARKWAYTVKGVPRDRAEIIVAEDNFHGRSTTIVGFSSIAQYRDGFGPFAPGFTHVPFGDADALAARHHAQHRRLPDRADPGRGRHPSCRRRAIWRGGGDLPRAQRAADLRRDQTGLGRTGRMLACQHDGVTPDAILLGKALGGGLLPVSLFLARREVMDVFRPGDHGSTFGGNPIAAAVGLAALDTLVDERLVERSAALGPHLLSRLAALDNPLIREVRGRGLFAGIELDAAKVRAGMVAERLLGAGLLTRETHHNTIRLAPPLIISKADIDWATDRIAEVLAALSKEVAEPMPVA